MLSTPQAPYAPDILTPVYPDHGDPFELVALRKSQIQALLLHIRLGHFGTENNGNSMHPRINLPLTSAAVALKNPGMSRTSLQEFDIFPLTK